MNGKVWRAGWAIQEEAGSFAISQAEKEEEKLNNPVVFPYILYYIWFWYIKQHQNHKLPEMQLTEPWHPLAPRLSLPLYNLPQL